jgi:uncharacterized protein YjiS (DUF1127 family)
MLPGSLQAERVLLAPSNGKSQRVVGFLSAIRRIPHTISLWFTRSDSRYATAMLSDHVLRDIGLTRNDFERELMKPFWRE